MSLPIITFSFNPFKLSILQCIAASVNTFVVSWNDAAEMKLSVLSDDFVIPINSGSAIAGMPPSFKTLSFSASKTILSTISSSRNYRDAGVFNPYVFKHLFNYNFYMLIVNFNALKPVNFLYFVDQKFG